jgi:prepilin-type N-terminal cleavage/methylation domain-containing protein
MSARRDCGFSLGEVLVVLAIVAIVSAMSVPMILSSLDGMKANGAARDVHSELQTARLKAVSANRPMRVRFNCPAAGQFRMVELIGTPATLDARDTAADRCSQTTYPYPPADTNALTRPNNDGPVQHLGAGITFTASQTIEFWTDGTAHADAGTGNPWPAIANSVTISLNYKTFTKSITVNGVGKVQIQ